MHNLPLPLTQCAADDTPHHVTLMTSLFRHGWVQATMWQQIKEIRCPPLNMQQIVCFYVKCMNPKSMQRVDRFAYYLL